MAKKKRTFNPEFKLKGSPLGQIGSLAGRREGSSFVMNPQRSQSGVSIGEKQ